MRISDWSSDVCSSDLLRFHIRDAFVDGDRLHVDTAAMKLVARMHGRSWYARSSDLFELDRPVYAKWAASREGAAGGGRGGGRNRQCCPAQEGLDRKSVGEGKSA